MKFLLGQKLKMTQIFSDTGRVVPATIVTTGALTLSQRKTMAKDGYEAVQFSFNQGKKVVKREVRLVGGETEAETAFAVGDVVQVSGISKGRGFQGVVKRHGFHGGPRSHGQKHSEREPGAIGGGGGRAGGRVAKGIRMAGRMGSDRVTVKNLKVIAVDAAKNEILISGAIPGRRGTLLEIYGK
ncbi:50S ribosomal protein L3 [Candidatus Nomurabacteria bacterium]|nr:50S ribosomal protein L3 [Candidatus Nomurabacteria bacterium]